MKPNKSNGFDIIFMTISPDYTTEPHQSPLTSLTLAGFVFITGFATVLERFGIGGRVILHAELALVLTALCAMAWFCRTMELKRFFIPFTTSGRVQRIAAALTWLLGAGLISGTMLFAPIGILLLIGPGLFTGADFSLRQSLSHRFPALATRMVITLVSVVSALALSASGFEACADVLSGGFEISRSSARLLVFGGILLPLLAGGFSAVLMITAFARSLTVLSLGLALINSGMTKPELRGAGSFFAPFWPQNVILQVHGLQTLNFIPQNIIDGLGLISSFMLCLALSLAAVQCCAANLTEGGIDPDVSFAPLSSQRLARNRLALICILSLCCFAPMNHHLEPDAGVQFSACLSLAGLGPVLALSLWPRAKSEAALLTFYVMGAALGGTWIYDHDHVVQTHLLYAMVGGGLATGLISLWFVTYRYPRLNRSIS